MQYYHLVKSHTSLLSQCLCLHSALLLSVSASLSLCLSLFNMFDRQDLDLVEPAHSHSRAHAQAPFLSIFCCCEAATDDCFPVLLHARATPHNDGAITRSRATQHKSIGDGAQRANAIIMTLELPQPEVCLDIPQIHRAVLCAAADFPLCFRERREPAAVNVPASPD